MKKISVFTLAICSALAFGQKVSDYKYILIPEKFETFKNNSYGLGEYLEKGLKSKSYVVLPKSIDQWPSEAKDNSCNVLNANILNDKSLFTNKVILQFKDCNNKVVLESKGRSDIKEFEEGFPDALKQALMNVGASNPVAMLPPVQTQASNVTKNSAQTSAPETTTTSSVVPTAGNYTNGKIAVQKIQIDESQFILAQAGSSVPFAVFKATSRKDVFMVKLADGNMTTGYFENGNIVIDIPQADGKFTKDVFTGK
ncbi:hypothetical protein SAMN05421786_106256 [Chryseobacterium ureilyticum]|uniref:Uncharacterized protein n=1 Tax=Chryseobacterium ureilyticum TaxID=373668 RepID=A0A1N7PVW6_9FLAO|nr:hypothetical protein [Chryseobacterium ureilyticum]SIT14803.1 hypothetical protein SAMN05421786_106256 [Chryseobacterium ureilyticum]